MPTLDIAKRQDELAAVDKKIDAETAKYEAATRTLRDQRSVLEKDYKAFLRSELASLGGEAPTRRTRGSGSKVDDEAVIGHLRRAQIEQSASDIKAGTGFDGSSNALSVALKRLTDEGRIKKTGEKRGTRYSIK